MASYVPNANWLLNFFQDPEENCVKGKNNVNTVFYTVIPENIESLTPQMQIYKINQFNMAVCRFNEEYSMRLYCLQQPFDFNYEVDRLTKIKENSDNKYIKKTCDVYINQYQTLASFSNDVRQKIYILAFSSGNGFGKIKKFVDPPRTFLQKAGRKVIPTRKYYIQQLFNEIFSLPAEHEGFEINKQRMQFKTNKYKVTNTLANGEREQH